ncbi:MAG: tRNA (adenosine(37)-N6)-threonylcarbamoyltransferase complex transferase subunit TsaD [Candidatus Micrarchaeota archaeon]|nr:tRNA (adenosine(37)-N6)-threonylcarbamoyltransferase complex transferase subunit TsaD [Candidatus Micrarchaeota archaeon]
MAVIGIESSAHTMGIGIVDRGKVVCNIKRMYRITDKGLIPARVADFHSEGVGGIISESMKVAGIGARDIEAIGYTKGPGLGACLRVGQLTALTLSKRLGVPVMPVNHAVAHIEIAKWYLKMRNPLALYVSGGNSQIIGLSEIPHRHYHIHGETFDVGVGNMIDNFARYAKLNPAWGSTVARSAEGGSYIEMPYTVKGMDFAFAGLLTNAEKLIDSGKSVRDVAYSLQETAFSMLLEASERAMMLMGSGEFLICGGVAQSARLKEMARLMCKAHGARFGVATDEYNADNGAMIALVAEKMFRSGHKPARSDCTVKQKYRIDSVRVGW